jgi:hypothetical protein
MGGYSKDLAKIKLCLHPMSRFIEKLIWVVEQFGTNIERMSNDD